MNPRPFDHEQTLLSADQVDFAEKVLEPMELDVKFEYAIAYPGKNMGRFSTSAKDQCWSPARQCEF